MGDQRNVGWGGLSVDFSNWPNTHESLVFSDSYLPAPTIVVGTPNPLAPSIQLTSPVESESWIVNSTHSISWSSAGGLGQLKVSLEYGMTGTDQWISIAADLPGSGSFAWKLPDTTSPNIYVMATVADSALPPNTASTTSRILVEAQQQSTPTVQGSVPEFSTGPIVAVFLLILVLLSVLFKKLTS